MSGGNGSGGQSPGDRTSVLFLGTEAVVPTANHDSASFVINRSYLVDSGWNAPIRMTAHGVSPLDIQALILTHCHHDHYMALPQLLFFLMMRRSERPNRPPLRIIGPAGEIETVLRLSRQFLQVERFPDLALDVELTPLRPGDAYEDDQLRLETCASLHPVPGLCYRVTDRRTGAALAFTGDTAYHPELPQIATGASLLIHEASYGAADTPAANSSLHSSAADAARVASEAGVERLALIHCPVSDQASAVERARAIFPNSFWPKDGETVLL